MMREAILACLVLAAPMPCIGRMPLFADEGGRADVTVDGRFVAYGFDDGRTSDFEWVAPLFTQYNAHATFNIINSDGHAKPEYVAKVNKLIAMGHEIGDHTILHQTYMYVHPFFNGQPEAGYVASKGAPSNEEMRRDQGNGRNIFNTPLDQKLKDSQLYKYEAIGISDPDNKTWRTLTDEDCQKIRNYYSVWNGGTLDYLDRLSAAFCGTTGSSKDADSWNGKEFTKGIFTGCRTTCNHEIWDRLVEIQRQWYTKYYALKTPPTNWSYPGGPHCPNLLYCKEQKRYFDRECTILANHYGRCRSTRTNRNRSWADLLRENGFKTVSDAMYEGRNDGALRRSVLIEMPFNANLSKDDNVCRLEYFDKVTFAPSVEYDPKQAPLAGSSDRLKTLYEVDGRFKAGIDKIVRNCAGGRIAFGLDDSVDTFTWRLLFEQFLQFSRKAGIRVISMREAYEIGYRTPLTKGNLFRNPTMERTVFKVIGAKNSPEAPDGWSAGRVVSEGEPLAPQGAPGAPLREAAPPGAKRALVLDGASRAEYFVFGLPLGNLDFSFSAVKGTGNSKLTIKKVRNVDPYLKSDGSEGEPRAPQGAPGAPLRCPVLKEIVIDDDNDWKQYRANLFLEDAPRLPSPSALSPTCDGLDNKICGLVFVLEGEKTRFAAPKLTSTAD